MTSKFDLIKTKFNNFVEFIIKNYPDNEYNQYLNTYKKYTGDLLYIMLKDWLLPYKEIINKREIKDDCEIFKYYDINILNDDDKNKIYRYCDLFIILVDDKINK